MNLLQEMSLAEHRELRDLIGPDEWREIAEQMRDRSDVSSDNWRVIHSNAIDDILVNELESDPYILGCFSPMAIAAATNWPQFLIEIAQLGERFENLGDAMTHDHVVELASLLVSYDGYGHHFAGYDGETHEIGDWYAFRI